MKEKILKAFEAYKNGERPHSSGRARYAFVINNEDNELYPVKIIWALANKYKSTSSFNTITAAKELKKYGFTSINAYTGLVYPTPEKDFDKLVQESLVRTNEDRQKRLQIASKKPHKRIVEIIYFDRNPDVVAEVLARANGICEKCNKPAPFNRKSNNTPYLEVHHIIPLSENGDDSIENCQALCPNCHRECHYG